MLSMTKQLVCTLEILQPQPSTTVPELNERWKCGKSWFLTKSAQTKIGYVKTFAVKCANKCNFRWKWMQLSHFFTATKTCPTHQGCSCLDRRVIMERTFGPHCLLLSFCVATIIRFHCDKTMVVCHRENKNKASSFSLKLVFHDLTFLPNSGVRSGFHFFPIS